MTLFEFLTALVGIPTVVGLENREAARIGKLCTDYAAGFFDGYSATPTGSLVFSRRCGQKNAKKLVLDAHFDTIGFAVSEIAATGFVKVKSMGGIDPYLLPATPVYLYTNKPLYGVFTSIPPHLAAKDSAELKVEDLYIDTGLSDADFAASDIEIGTPAGFAEPPVLLQNNLVASHSLDDKACAATILHACRLLAQSGREPTDTDIFVHLSVGEEKTGVGARTLPYTVLDGFDFAKADGALVMDVNFGHAPGCCRLRNRSPSERAAACPIRPPSSARLPILSCNWPHRKNFRFKPWWRCARPAPTPEHCIAAAFRALFYRCRSPICTPSANAFRSTIWNPARCLSARSCASFRRQISGRCVSNEKAK